MGRARDGERVRRTVRAAGLSERTESGKGREWERAGPKGKGWGCSRVTRGKEGCRPGWVRRGVGLGFLFPISVSSPFFLFQTTPKLI